MNRLKQNIHLGIVLKKPRECGAFCLGEMVHLSAHFGSEATNAAACLVKVQMLSPWEL